MNLNSFINHQTKNINLASLILILSALVSRALGVVRNWLLASNFGAGSDLDIYFAAFKIPDFIYQILILGGITVAFLPLFSEYYSQNKNSAWEFVSNTLNIFFLLLVSLGIASFILSPLLVGLVAPGFDATQVQKTVLLTRIMLLSPVFFGLSSFFSGILQYFNRFLAYSLTPIFYNLGIIFGILFFAPKFGVLGVALGVVLGAFLHFLIQIPSAINAGFSYKPIFNLKDGKIKKAFLLMAPRVLGISAQQINLFVITAIASTLSVGSISIFNFANDIQHFPVGVVGASFAVAVFPLLSKTWAKSDKERFVKNFYFTLRKILYLIIPISTLIFVLRNQIVKLLLEHGLFSDLASELTAASLGVFCFGIFSAALIPLVYRAFFALKDTKSPTIIAIFAMALNVLLSFFLVKILDPQSTSFFAALLKNLLKSIFSLQGVSDFSILGLPLAVSISTIFQFSVSIFVLNRKLNE
jgi:putative peptidoglycan lipid II flippase